MVRLNVLYPAFAGARFDHTYYRDRHLPMVVRLLGPDCSHYTIDKGLAGGTPGAPSPYVAGCSIACKSAEALQAAMGAHAREIMANIPNYTDVQPVIWISEAVAAA